MNLKEYAELNQITLAHAKKLTGLSHWKQEVIEQAPEPSAQHDSNGVTDISYHSHSPLKEIVEEVLDVVEIVKPVEVAVIKAVIDLITQEDKRKSVKGLGTKSPYWSELNA